MLPKGPRAVYIHVPFCKSHCSYCDFYSEVAGPAVWAIWQDGMRQELVALARYPKRQPLQTIYYGGGTPSLVDPAYIAEQIATLRDLFGIDPAAELTLEANPESVTLERALRWCDAGINRVSLGVQSVDAALLRLLARPHTKDEAARAIEALKAAGIANISADLMLGLPGQTVELAIESADFLMQAGVGHLSFYALSLAPGTPLYARYAAIFPNAAEEDEERAMYWAVRQRVGAAGFEVYELSNAARPGYASRHNSMYWTGDPYFGLGPAAASFVDGVRRANPADLTAWRKRLDDLDGAAYTAALTEEIIDREAAMREALLLGLRRTRGVDDVDFQGRFGVSLFDVFANELAALQHDDLVVREAGTVRLSRHGIDFANLAFARFV